MAAKDARTIPIVNAITMSDICGLWEVIRICEGKKKQCIPGSRIDLCSTSLTK